MALGTTAEREVVARPKIVYLVTEDWYFCSHRMPMARAAKELGFDVVVATRVSGDGECLRNEGFRVVPLEWRRRGGGLGAELKSFRDLVRLYRNERPDIVHHVAMKPVLVGSLAARVARLPTVLNAIMGLGYAFTDRTIGARATRRFIVGALRALWSGTAWRVLIQNSEDGAILERAGVVNSDRICLIAGSGVDVDRFRASPLPAGSARAVLVARMIRPKGIEDFVEAARILKERGADIRMILAGEADAGNRGAIPPERLEGWKREGVVEWNGRVRDVSRLWEDSHIAVLPSHAEGIPKSLIEAASCARPVVATDVRGCRDVVEQGVSGVLVPPRDPHALADAIQELANDRELCARMGKRGRELVIERFSEEVVMSHIRSLYVEMVTGVGSDDR